MERRDFLKSAVAGGLAAGAANAASPLPKRPYKDGISLSIVGYGGVVSMGLAQEEVTRLVALSVERGVNYFDVAPSYGNGEAEEKLGPALEPYRKKVFLACKTGMRDAAGARKELERSLQRLKTDHFDLYQFHHVTTMDDVNKILAPGGAGEAFFQARKEGKVKYLGCSVHSVEGALAMIEKFPLDSILFPCNYVLYSQGNFGPQILAKAKEKGIARMAIKALARTRWPKGAEAERAKRPKCWYEPITDPEQARQAIRFTLSEDITAAIPPGDEKLYALMLDLAAGFKPLAAAERETLLASAKGVEPLFRA